MAKRIVNKAERNAERYDAKETGYRLFEDSQNGKTFDRLMPLIVSEQNIILAYRNICKNSGSKTPSTDGKTIVEIQSLPIESVIKTVRNKLNYYQPKKVKRVEIPKDNGKTRPLGIPSIWDRLIQQCILQILEPICEAKFHERNNGFRPYRSTQNAIAQCYKMAQLQNLHFFFLIRGRVPTSAAALIMVFAMLPGFLLALYERHGQPLEVVVWQIVQCCFIQPKERPYQTDNAYTALMRQHQMEKEVNAIVRKAKKRAACKAHPRRKAGNTGHHPQI